MMDDFPLLDLRDALRDAQRCLHEAAERAEEEYAGTDDTWQAMGHFAASIRALHAQALTIVPAQIALAFTHEETRLNELEAQCDTGY